MKRTICYQRRNYQQVEWGLWRCLDDKNRALIYYRPSGSHGKLIRQVAKLSEHFTFRDVQQFIRFERAKINARKIGAGAVMRTPASMLILEYERELERLNRSPSHIADVRRVLARFTSRYADLAAAEITEAHITRHLSGLGGSARTHNKELAIIAAWLSWATRRGTIARNPAISVERSREHRTLKVYPTTNEVLRLTQNATERGRAIIAILTLTGLRRQSVCGLTPSDATGDGIIIRTTKEKNEWLLRFDEGCPLWLPELALLVRMTCPVSLTIIRTELDAALEKAKLASRFTAHSFRHAFGSWLVAAGESMADVSRWMHHSSTAITESWYAHERPRGRKRAAENQKSLRNFSAHVIGLCGVKQAAKQV